MLRILIALIIVAAIGYWYWTTTPQYAMEQVKHAIKSHDLTTFGKYVDTDAVAAGMVDDLLAAPMRHLLGPGIFGQWIVAGLVGVLKGPIADGIKDDINHFVLTGELVRPESSGTGQPSLSLGLLDGHLGFRKHAFKRIEYVQKNDKVCTMGLLFHNQVYDKDLVLEVKMRECGGYWRLIELSNFPAFTAKLIELQAGQPHEAVPSDEKTGAHI